MTPLVFFLESPLFPLVYNFDSSYYWGLVEGTGVDIINNMDIYNMLVGFLGAQMHVVLKDKCEESVEVENNSRKSVLGQLRRVIAVLHFISY